MSYRYDLPSSQSSQGSVQSSHSSQGSDYSPDIDDIPSSAPGSQEAAATEAPKLPHNMLKIPNLAMEAARWGASPTTAAMCANGYAKDKVNNEGFPLSQYGEYGICSKTCIKEDEE